MVYGFDVATRTVVSTLTLGFNSEGITALPNTNIVLVNSLDIGGVRVLTLNPDGTFTDTGTTIGTGIGPRNVTASPDGRLALVANWDGNSVAILQIDGGVVTNGGSLPLGHPQSIAFTPDGQRAYVATSDGQVAVLNIDASRAVTDSGVRITIAPVLSYFGVDQITAVGPGRMLVHSPSLIQVIDTTTNTLVGQGIPIANDDSAGGIAFIPPQPKQ
jgi:DNA-binding beta-propeller fold protein YncE